MTDRLWLYLRVSFPPLFYLPYAAAWSLGGTAMFALARRHAATWRPGAATFATLASFIVLLLLIRAIDDLRDLEYDREHNPRRPLASGAVRASDLATLLIVGTLVLLLLNVPRGSVWQSSVLGLCYAVALMAVDRWLRWPPGDAVVLNALISIPAQSLLGLYLYIALLHDTHSTAGADLILPLAVMLAIFTHLEFARKVARHPRPGERTYVFALGLGGTVCAALAAAALATVLSVLLTRPWAPGAGWAWLVLAPAVLPVRGALRFHRSDAERWPVMEAGNYVLSAFTVFLVIDLLERHTP
jgi:4-hydroxybenzoate polyprenyltransferase